jgi:DNA-binding NarL/FixJ family response regulator
MTAPGIRVLLVDDHGMVRSGLHALLDTEPDMQVVGEASQGLDGVKAAAELLPDIVVMDLWMPGMGGLEATERISALSPGVRVLALTALEDQSSVQLAIAAGACGYVLKRSASDELVRAIRAVAAGETYLDASMAGRALVPLRHRPKAMGAAQLSERELNVLRRIAAGHTMKEIAATLAISVRTLETYRTRAMDKLGLQNRADIVRYAVQRGWLTERS